MHLQLVANSIPLVLDQANLNLTLLSPFASESSGGYVFSATVPYEPNARTFGFPARLNRMQVQTATAVGAIIFKGTRVQPGQWNARSSTAKVIEIEMVIGGSHFNTLVDGKLVGEVFNEVDEYESLPDYINSSKNDVYPAVNYKFPSILNTAFYGDEANPLYSGIINLFIGDIIADSLNTTTIIPQFYLLYVVKQIYLSQGYAATGPVFSDEYFKTLLLYNNYALDHLISVSFYGEVVQDIIASPYQVKWDTNINDPLANYSLVNYKYLIEYEGRYEFNINLKAVINEPADDVAFFVIRLKYGSALIQERVIPVSSPEVYATYSMFYPHTFLAEDTGDYIYVEAVFVDIRTDVVVAYVDEGDISIINTTYQKLNDFQHTITYANHMPKKDIKEFLNAFFSFANVMPFFNHELKTVELYFLRDLLGKRETVSLENGLIENTLKVYPNTYKGLTFKLDFQGPDELLKDNFILPKNVTGEITSYDELPTNPSIGEVYYIRSLNAYYENQFIEAEDKNQQGSHEWICICDLHQDQVFDSGKETITAAIAPMLMRFHKMGTHGRNLPSIEAQGTSVAYSLEAEFPLRVMAYSGMKTPLYTLDLSGATDYPLATSTKFDTKGNEVQPINFRMNDLITRYWVETISWYKRRFKVEFTHLVTPSFIQRLDAKKPFFFENSIFRFTEIVVKIKNKLFGPGDFEGWVG